MLIVIAVLIVPVAALTWWLSVRSRRTYVCPSCGAEITVEHMSASSCNICGAELREYVGER